VRSPNASSEPGRRIGSWTARSPAASTARAAGTCRSCSAETDAAPRAAAPLPPAARPSTRPARRRRGREGLQSARRRRDHRALGRRPSSPPLGHRPRRPVDAGGGYAGRTSLRAARTASSPVTTAPRAPRLHGEGSGLRRRRRGATDTRPPLMPALRASSTRSSTPDSATETSRSRGDSAHRHTNPGHPGGLR
jgi:hypothetical protein